MAKSSECSSAAKSARTARPPRRARRLVFAVMCCALVAATLGVAFATEKIAGDTTVLGGTQEVSSTSEASATTAKDEVVYGKLDASGAVDGIYVVNVFSSNAESLKIKDPGAYTKVTNLTTTEKLENVNGATSFSIPKGRFYYQGDLDASKTKLPWTIAITYKLDGKTVTADALGGASGKLTARIDVTPSTGVDPVFADNYLLQISGSFPGDVVSNIVAEGATIAEAGSNLQVSYMTLPGGEGHYTITADVENFSYDGFQIAGVPMSLALDISDEDLSGMTGQLTDLSDAIGSIDDGVGSLASGGNQIEGGLDALAGGNTELTGGSSLIASGVADAASGASELSSQVDTQLVLGMETLAGGSSQVLSGLTQGITEAQAGSVGAQQSVTDAQTALTGSMQAAGASLTGAGAGLATAGGGLQMVSTNLVAAVTSVTTAKAVLATISTALSTVATSLGDASTGLGTATTSLGTASAKLGDANTAANIADSELTSIQLIIEDKDSLSSSDINSLADHLGAATSALATTRSNIGDAHTAVNEAKTATTSVTTAVTAAATAAGTATGAVGDADTSNTVAGELDKAEKALSGTTPPSETGSVGEGLTAVQTGLGQAQTNLAAVDLTDVGTKAGGVATAAGTLGGLQGAAGALLTVRDGTATSPGGYTAFDDGIQSMIDKSNPQSIYALSAGISSFSMGLSTLSGKYALFHDGLVKYASGVSSLAYNYRIFQDGIVTLADGTTQLRDATSNLDQKLIDGVKDQIADYLGGDFTPRSFVEASNTNVNQVQFVIMTAAVSVPEAPEEEAPVEEELGILDRLLALFS